MDKKHKEITATIGIKIRSSPVVTGEDPELPRGFLTTSSGISPPADVKKKMR